MRTPVAARSRLSSAVAAGHDFPHPLPKIFGKGLELFAVAQRTEPIHCPEAAALEAARIQKRDERTNSSGRDRPLR